jgi:hypothetical protein
MGVPEDVSDSLCIFCGRRWGEVKKSEEHVLGHLRRRPGDLRNERTSYSTGLAFDAESQQFIVEPMTTDERPSSLLNLRTRRVCEPCNIGWMSRLETLVKPLLKALEGAAESGGQLELSRAEALVVARWALKTAVTHELTNDWPKVADVQVGAWLREGKPVRGSIVWVARNEQDLDAQIRHALIELSDTAVVRPGDSSRLAFICAITWHYLTLLVYLGTPGRLGPQLPFDRWTPVSPCSPSGIEYPPIQEVSRAELDSRLSDQRYWLPVVHHLGVRSS